MESAIERFLAECGQNCGCPVTVRYECGDCCLKATNRKLAGTVGQFLAVKAFSAPGIITVPCECEGDSGPSVFGSGCSGPGCGPYPPPVIGAQCALIPLDRVCCIESGSVTPVFAGVNAVAEAETAEA